MSRKEFRTTAPVRTYSGVQSNYRSYKPYLIQDFRGRCGYTDSHHFWFGGSRNFQIDHFKCVSKFPALVAEYGNLVYSCSYINRAKSDDDGEYLDPCDTDYNEHFYRDDNGNIYANPNSNAAVYMHRKLKLYLRRYGVIWTLQQLGERLDTLETLILATDNQSAKDLYIELSFKFRQYLKYLSAEQ